MDASDTQPSDSSNLTHSERNKNNEDEGGGGGVTGEVTQVDQELPLLELKLKTIDNVTHPIKASLSWTVKRFKEQIEQELGIGADLQRLLFRGRLFRDEQTLSEFKLKENYCIHLIQRVAPQPANVNSTTGIGEAATGASASGNSHSTGNSINAGAVDRGAENNNPGSQSGQTSSSPPGTTLRQWQSRRNALFNSISLPSLASTVGGLSNAPGGMTTRYFSTRPLAPRIASRSAVVREEPPPTSLEHLCQSFYTMNTLFSTMRSTRQMNLPIPEVTFEDDKDTINSRANDNSAPSIPADLKVSTDSLTAAAVTSEGSSNDDACNIDDPKTVSKNNEDDKSGGGQKQGKKALNTSDTLSAQSPATDTLDGSETNNNTRREKHENLTLARAKKFYIGQWLDVKDTVNQWLESTIMDMNEHSLYIHYNGWPVRWDEWIEKNSDRLAPFRTMTPHSMNSSRLSPTPTFHVADARRLGTNDAMSVFMKLEQMLKATTPLMAQLIRAASDVRQMASGGANPCQDDMHGVQNVCKSSTQVTKETERDENKNPTNQAPAAAAAAATSSTSWVPGTHQDRLLLAEEVAPVIDRLGRMMTDIAPHLKAMVSSPSSTSDSRSNGIMTSTPASIQSSRQNPSNQDSESSSSAPNEQAGRIEQESHDESHSQANLNASSTTVNLDGTSRPTLSENTDATTAGSTAATPPMSPSLTARRDNSPTSPSPIHDRTPAVQMQSINPFTNLVSMPVPSTDNASARQRTFDIHIHAFVTPFHGAGSGSATGTNQSAEADGDSNVDTRTNTDASAAPQNATQINPSNPDPPADTSTASAANIAAHLAGTSLPRPDLGANNSSTTNSVSYETINTSDAVSYNRLPISVIDAGSSASAETVPGLLNVLRSLTPPLSAGSFFSSLAPNQDTNSTNRSSSNQSNGQVQNNDSQQAGVNGMQDSQNASQINSRNEELHSAALLALQALGLSETEISDSLPLHNHNGIVVAATAAADATVTSSNNTPIDVTNGNVIGHVAIGENNESSDSSNNDDENDAVDFEQQVD